MEAYKLTEDAKNDLYRIWLYGLNKFGQTQADKYFQEFIVQFKVIGKEPLLFPVVDEIRTGYRRCVCGSDTIYFRIQKEYVEITAIIGSQDISVWP